MAVKNVVIPWISGGALLLGYAAFAWLRGKQGAKPALPEGGLPHPGYDVAPLLDRLERVPEELALSSVPEPAASPEPAATVMAFDEEADEPPPAPQPAAARRAGALFLGRASSALSPFQNRSWASR